MVPSPRTPRPARVALSALLAFGLVCGLSPVPAHAAEPSLEELEEAAIAAGDEYQAAQDELDELNGRIEENEARLAELEAEIPQLREDCAEAIRSSYKMQQAQPGLVTLLLSAEDFNEFLTTAGYLDSVSRSNLQDMAELAEAQEELEETRESLEAQRASAQDKADAAEEAYNKAQAAAEQARAKATERAEQARAAYEAQQQAKAQDEAAKAEQPQDAKDDAAEAPAQEEAPAVTEPEPAQPAGDDAGGEWTWVGASTYGIGDGFLWGTTASGDTVTPTSMGVAMKTMPLGTTIEITYNGRTCTAVVNDRGPFVAGREIDLQPAVAQALGFSGVGTVGYRVVG